MIKGRHSGHGLLDSYSPPWPCQWWRHRHAWSHSLPSSACTWSCRTERIVAASAHFDRSSRMPGSFVSWEKKTIKILRFTMVMVILLGSSLWSGSLFEINEYFCCPVWIVVFLILHQNYYFHHVVIIILICKLKKICKSH